MVGHGLVQSLGGVGRVVRAQVVGLVVQHPVAPTVLEHQIGKTHQHAVQLRLGQFGARHAGQQMLPAQGIDFLRVQPVCGQPELHLGQHVHQRIERCIRPLQRLRHHTRQPIHDDIGLGLVACAIAALEQALGCGRSWLQGKTIGGQPLELVM